MKPLFATLAQRLSFAALICLPFVVAHAQSCRPNDGDCQRSRLQDQWNRQHSNSVAQDKQLSERFRQMDQALGRQLQGQRHSSMPETAEAERARLAAEAIQRERFEAYMAKARAEQQYEEGAKLAKAFYEKQPGVDPVLLEQMAYTLQPGDTRKIRVAMPPLDNLNKAMHMLNIIVRARAYLGNRETTDGYLLPRIPAPSANIDLRYWAPEQGLMSWRIRDRDYHAQMFLQQPADSNTPKREAEFKLRLSVYERVNIQSEAQRTELLELLARKNADALPQLSLCDRDKVCGETLSPVSSGSELQAYVGLVQDLANAVGLALYEHDQKYKGARVLK
jgi:hypothetical protein